MARSVEDLRLLLDAIMGPAALEAPGWRISLPNSRAETLNGFRVALLCQHQACDVDDGTVSSILELAEALRRCGARVDDQVEWPIDLDVCHQDYMVMARAVALRHGSPEALQRMAEGSSPLEETDRSYRAAGRRAAGLSHHGWHVMNERRHQFRLAWQRFFQSYDVVLCPVHATQAFPHNLETAREDRTILVNGRFQDYNASLFWLAIAGLSYLPVTVRPIRLSNGLPVGVQIIGPYLEDATTLRFAELLEELCPRLTYPLARPGPSGGRAECVSHWPGGEAQ
jgi:amidase